MKTGFKFLKDTSSGKWVILAPKRADRPDVAANKRLVCPLCPGRERLTTKEVYRVGPGKENTPGWQIRVVPNKYPFAPIHELIIQSPNHEDNFFSYKPDRIAKIIQVYKERYLHWHKEGHVIIFHNHGSFAGESLSHSHSQLVVMPWGAPMETPKADDPENIICESGYFTLFAPKVSSWPYEIWFLPRHRGSFFGDIDPEEINDLAKLFSKMLNRLKKELQGDFPFNFYIYHGKDWYLRFIPRLKAPGGFELGTGIFVNTQPPEETARDLSW
jgi:UDPglucose--hexose-1-phosphate uridylyltransferase